MKAKYYIGIISLLMLTCTTLKAQNGDMRNYRNDDAKIVVNNYYDDYDYYFSSRINRFHRSYSAFDYYAPVFTETYWYNYQPYSWGISIYGGGGFGIGYSYNYPVYSYNYGGYDPYFGGGYYWGYDPFYYNNWYTPIVINIGLRNRWHNDYYGWRGRNNHYNDYRPVYNTYNNNYYSNSSTRYSSSGISSRRNAPSTSSSRTTVDRNNSNQNSSSGQRTGESRRNSATDINRGQGNNNSGNGVNQGNSNVPVRRSAEVRNGTNGNSGTIIKSANPSNGQVIRRVEQPASSGRNTNVSSGSAPSRSVSTPSRASSSTRSGSSASQGRSTSVRSESKSSSSGSSSSSTKSTKRR